jgi:subtilisin family serine protease
MRRFLATALSVCAATTLFAAEPNLRVRDRERVRDGHVILSVTRPLTPADRAELAAKGVQVQSALTGGRYIARAANASVLDNDGRFTSVDALRADQKILRSAYRAAARAATWADVNVMFHADVTFDEARAIIAAAGGTLDDPFTLGFAPLRAVDARIAPASLGELAGDDRVLAIGGRLALKQMPQNAKAAQLSNVDDVHAAPYGLSGQGQVVTVSELSEAQKDHPEFEGRMTAEGGVEDMNHSTHVSGTVGAAGLRADAKGMAPKVQIREFNVTGSTRKHIGLLAERLPALGAVATNVSLGIPLGWCVACEGLFPTWNDEEEYYGAYDADITAPFDQIVQETGTLIVFAAGNYGDYPNLPTPGKHHHVNSQTGDTDTSKTWCFSPNKSGTDCPAECNGGCEITPHHLVTPFDTMTVTGAGKNVLAVGALQWTGVGNPTIATFSSRGPAKDGRVKPDVVARGQSLISTAPTNNYASNSGTSMAAPVITGIVALLGEQWQKTFGARAKPEVLKALVIAGSTDLGTPGPDYTYGYGLADAKNSADLIIADNATGSRIRTLTVSDKTEHEVRFTTTATQKLRVLVSWADPTVVLLGDDAIEAKALVNDIDARLIGPDGTTYSPYFLDRVKYEDAAKKGVNSTDNHELIEIDNAPAGTYRLLVNGTNVTDGPQSVIVISNAPGQFIAPPCSDANEANDSAGSATSFGANNLMSGAVCTAADVDFFSFPVNEAGAVSAALTTGDTAMRMTLEVSGKTATVDVPAQSTRTVTIREPFGTGLVFPTTAIVKVEPIGAVGSNPRYDLAVASGQLITPKKRSVR